MREALLSGVRPPRLVVTVVWDGGGRDVLETWPRAWPDLRRLIDGGTWFERAIVGSSPIVAPASHATLGTGVFPRTHGEVDINMRIGPTLTSSGDNGVRLLVEPTFADLYDRSLRNEPLVGTVATGVWHLNMMSHGSMWGGGDRDLAVLKPSRALASGPWELPTQVQPFFSIPRYVNDVDLAPYVAELDRADGRIDERWRDHPFTLLDDGFDTPARIPYQTELIERMIKREGFGADDVPDPLFANYKLIDLVGHAWSVNSPEMRETLEVQDAELARLVKILNRHVGRGQWVLMLTADHGSQFDPALTGAFRISQGQLGEAIDDRFDDGDGVGVVEAVHSTQVFLDVDELDDVGADVVDVARFLLAFTQADGARFGADAVDPDAPVLALAIPPALLEQLPCLSP